MLLFAVLAGALLAFGLGRYLLLLGSLATLLLLLGKTMAYVKSRHMLHAYPRPRRFDRDLIVIGAGSGGLVSAYLAAAMKAKVTLIEKHRMGGDCLNTGCVPSKALLRSAKFLSQVHRAHEFGCDAAHVEFDFARIMERVQRVIRQIEPHDCVDRYTALGVDCIQGEARIVSPYSVTVNGRTLTTRHIVIATGAQPTIPPIPGIETVAYYTSDTIWHLRTLPARLLVLGGGPVGCELAQAFARFGSHVVQLQRGSYLLKNEDPEISELLMTQLTAEGVDLRMNHTPQEFIVQNGRKLLCAEHAGQSVDIEFDALLVAVGRTANTRGFGLEELDIPLRDDGTIAVNAYLQTRLPNIYAVGDVTGPYQFTHVAAHQAWYAVVNSLFGVFKRFRVDYSVIPRASFTEPEIARVGLNEQEAQRRGIAYEVTRYPLDDLDRAIADEAAQGLVKVLTVPGKDQILGVTIAGEHAGDLIAEFIVAMRHGLGLNKILGTIPSTRRCPRPTNTPPACGSARTHLCAS